MDTLVLQERFRHFLLAVLDPKRQARLALFHALKALARQALSNKVFHTLKKGEPVDCTHGRKTAVTKIHNPGSQCEEFLEGDAVL
jgi:hypothetical protein